jgi:hypothetical protein
MKFNWGWGIATALGAFVLAMGYTIYLTTQNDYILETENYYQKELEYDQVVDAVTFGNTFFEGVEWSEDDSRNVEFQLPIEIDSARCILIHPADNQWDRSVRVSQVGGEVLIHLSEEAPMNVLWRMEFSAFINGKEALLKKRWNY